MSQIYGVSTIIRVFRVPDGTWPDLWLDLDVPTLSIVNNINTNTKLQIRAMVE